MKKAFMRQTAMTVCAVLLTAAGAVRAQYPDLRITEAMSSSGTGGTVDWFELTNYGLSSATLTGWQVDDSSFAFANSVLLNGVTSIAAGESVIFLESAGGAAIASFRTFWGDIDLIQIGYYSGSGVGLSASGDGLVCFDSGGTEVTPRVTFTAATTGSSFCYSYDTAGNPDTSPNAAALVSVAGTLYGQVTDTSDDALGNIGSPGTAVAVPEPTTGALLGLGVAGLLIRRLRRLRKTP